MARIMDHIATDDDGEMTLCGLSIDELPDAPLCPVCRRQESRLRLRESWRVGRGMVRRLAATARR